MTYLKPVRTGDHTTISEAQMDLQEMEQTVREDHPDGDDAVEAGYHDLVHAVAERCTPEVAEELIRRNL